MKLRRLMPALEELGLDSAGLLRLGARAARASDALDACAANLRARALLDAGAEAARFDAAALREAPLELLQRLLAGEIARLAPGPQLRLDRLERAALRLSGALNGGRKLRITLADLLLDAETGAVTLRPAPPRKGSAPEAREGS